jgi:hypothetical protein
VAGGGGVAGGGRLDCTGVVRLFFLVFLGIIRPVYAALI